MARKLVALLFTCCFVLQSFADPPAKTASVQPNVIIIFIDDMGLATLALTAPKDLGRLTWTKWPKKACSFEISTLAVRSALGLEQP